MAERTSSEDRSLAHRRLVSEHLPVCIELEHGEKTPSPPCVPSSNSCAGFPTGASLTECCDTSVSPRCRAALGKPRQVDLIFNYLGQLDQLVAACAARLHRVNQLARSRGEQVMIYVNPQEARGHFIYSEALHGKRRSNSWPSPWSGACARDPAGASTTASLRLLRFNLARLTAPRSTGSSRNIPVWRTSTPSRPCSGSSTPPPPHRCLSNGDSRYAERSTRWTPARLGGCPARHAVLRTAFVSEGLGRAAAGGRARGAYRVARGGSTKAGRGRADRPIAKPRRGGREARVRPVARAPDPGDARPRRQRAP